MKAHSTMILATLVLLLSACGIRNQDGSLADGEMQDSPYITVKSNGTELTIDSTCTQRLAQREGLRESDVNSATVARYLSTCQVKQGRGSHQRSGFALNLSYFYPYNYQSYNYNGFGCSLFFGSYASNWNSNCAYTFGGYSPYWYGGNNWNYNNYCYNYYSNYNYGYSYSGSSYSFPSYCYNRMYY